MEEPRARKAEGSEGDPGPDPPDVAGESSVGSAEDPQGVAETRHRGQPGHGVEVHGSPPEATVAELAYVLEESCQRYRLDRLLHRSHSDVPDSLRVSGAVKVVAENAIDKLRFLHRAAPE